MKPRRPALSGASKAIRATVAGSFLVAALCLAGTLAAFLVYPAYAQSSDEASAPSSLTAAIADGGVILNWSSPGQDAASVTGYQILRRRPWESEPSLLVLVADTDSTATAYVDATADEPGTQYFYRVKALRGGVKSSWSNYARVDLPEEADETEPTPAPEPRDGTVQPKDTQSGDQCPDPTPTKIVVSRVPIEVSSTTSDYFVLYANVGGSDIPVQVKRGESGATTLEENIKALPASDYRVEKYAVADPADVDGDCLDDLADPSPLNHSRRVELDPADGAMVIADSAHFWELANIGVVRFTLIEVDSSTPELYFQNTNTHQSHLPFLDLLSIDVHSKIWDRGWLQYDSTIFYNGNWGVFHYVLGGGYISTSTSSGIRRLHTFLAANLPFVDHNLAFRLPQISDLPSDWIQVENPRVPVVDGQFLYRDVTYSALNAGEGYGRLQALEPDERPNPRDIVLYETLPNELSRVAGIISTQPQTPLSHVDLRAKQNKIPNAFIRDALDMTEISSLVGEYVYLRVTEDEFEIREATKAEVDAHYESLRPTARQSPERDLSVQAIAPLSEIGFEDHDAFGVKAANVAELGKLGFPQGTVPDGFAIPFYFYDEFMKHNDLYAEVDELLADEEFLTDYDEQEDELKKLRKKIKKGESPDWMIEALETMHDAYPEGQSLRYRSSTNNEDLPMFSGAGLYDSNTQKPKETEEDGIDKSMKQVFASLWNFRAFVERGFYRIDHSTTAMGILVHPNYTEERVNGVAVSFDPLYGKAGHHYVNSQVGEDLVTNPDAYSLPEELLLTPDGSSGILHYSNQQENDQLLMTESQMIQLRRHLDTIHAHFDELYDIEAYAIEIEFKITSDDVLAIKQARPWVFGSDAPPLPDRAGTLTLSPTQPRVGAAVTASLTDPDGSISNITWQWAGSPNGSSNWANIGGAASTVYTPVAGDVGNYLRAMASYTDGHGSGKSARAVSANPVQVAPPPPPPPVPVELAWSSNAVIASEDDGAVTLLAVATTTKDKMPESGFSFEVVAASSDGTASQPDDYGQLSVRATFTRADFSQVTVGGRQRYQAVKQFPVIIVDDDIDEANETFTATLAYADPSQTHLTGGNSTATVTITDDELVPVTIAWQQTALTVNEGSGSAVLRAVATTTEDKRPEEGFSFGVSVTTSDGTATQPGDYADLSESATFARADFSRTTVNGQQRYQAVKQFTVNIERDSDDERDENFTATLAYSNPGPSHLRGGPDTMTVTIADDAGNDEQPLTATVHDVPSSHNGQDAFTFELRFSEDPKPDFSYTTVRDNAFTVTGGSVTYVRRLVPPSNIGWEVHVTPDGNGDVNLSLRSTNNCSAQGAICTGEGRKLSGGLQLGVAGPNTPATGAPSITGTARVGETLTAGTTGISDGDGLGNAVFAYQWLADDSNISDATDSTYTLVAADAGKAIRVRVSFTDDGENGEELTSTATGAVDVAPPPPNTPATGAPTISGTARVSETLTASTTDISDADGMTRATFSYQWLADDSNISDATDSAYTLVAADAGKAIRVRVSFTDDGENGEVLTSAATGAVAAAVVNPPLTASPRNVPSSHDGSATFLFELRFSEEFPLSYVTLRDHAFTVTGGTVVGVRRLDRPGNIRWEISVSPDSNGDVTVVLPSTTDCEANGAICTEDGRRLSASIYAIVSGPAPVGTVPVAVIVSGTTRVAEGATVSFTISLNRAAPTALSVAVSVADAGGVLSGAAPRSVAFATRDNSKTITLPTRDDNAIKTASTVTVSLATGSGYTLGTATSASVSVTDNDTAVWTVSAQPTEIAEGGSSTITLAVANGKTFTANQTVSLAVSGTASGSDYSLSATEVTLPADASSVTATLTARDDASVESDETVIVTATHDGQPIGSATVTIEANDVPLSNNATLSTLSLSGIDIGAFSSGTTDYSVIVEYDVASTTVTADPNDDGASVAVADANGVTYGTSRQVSLSTGDNEITVTVTAEDENAMKVYTVTVTRSEPDVAWGERLPDRDIVLDSDAIPTGLWADDTNAWVISDCNVGEVAVYALSDGSKQDELSFTLADWSGCATALWSNGATLWVADFFSNGVRAYRLSDGARQSDQDLDRDAMLAAGNTIPSGLWSNGEIMWVADHSAGKVFAYRLSDWARVSTREFDLTDDGGVPIRPFGLWSNGETLLASNWNGDRVLAFDLSDGQRQTSLDIDTSASGTRNSGIWSDGETLWIVDDLDKRIYAYAVQGLGSTR